MYDGQATIDAHSGGSLHVLTQYKLWRVVMVEKCLGTLFTQDDNRYTGFVGHDHGACYVPTG